MSWPQAGKRVDRAGGHGHTDISGRASHLGIILGVRVNRWTSLPELGGGSNGTFLLLDVVLLAGYFCSPAGKSPDALAGIRPDI